MNESLRRIPLFAGLPDADLERLAGRVEEVRLPAGGVLFAEGAPGDRAYVILDGQLEVVKASEGREVLLAVRTAGEVIGEMALLEQTPRTATVRARTDSTLVALGKDVLDNLLDTSHSATRALFQTVLARWRATEAVLRQSERMAQLGTLTAGVAHELNNPAAAVKRAADQLGEAMAEFARACAALSRLEVTPAQQGALEKAASALPGHVRLPPQLDPVARSDREAEVEEWLAGFGVEDAWEIAPGLVGAGYDRDSLEALARGFEPPKLPAVTRWLVAGHAVHTLVNEVGIGAGRISDIVKALKSYSYLDQAPMQDVDLREGLDNTLLILGHKLRPHTVRREYDPSLPKVHAYGSELNQVWTNILDNAADALGDHKGTVTIRTRTEGAWAVVEIEDDGPGIPAHIQPRIFDAFFTTKPPGKGTGLGLNITYNIVVHKHRGEIRVDSRPGSTRFTVRLPLTPGQ